MPTNFWQLPFWSKFFLIFISGTGLGILAAACQNEPFPLTVDLGIFLLLAVVTGTKRVHLTPKLGTMSVGFAVVLAALLHFGVAPGLVVAAVSAIAGTLISQRTGKLQPLHRILFAIGTIVIAAWGASEAFVWAGGKFGSASLSGLLTPLILATAAYYGINTFLVAMISGLTQHQNPLRVWQQDYLWTGPGYFAGASAAALLHYAYGKIGAAGFALVAPVLYITYYSYRVYTEKIQDNLRHIEELRASSERLAHLYLSTIQSLALAIDAKDPYTHTHIMRVQDYAVKIAREMGLSEEIIEGIQTGALLHDVGKIGVPEHILTKPGRLSDEEYRKIQKHPLVGYEILKPIDFPWSVHSIVRNHHEWWNGNGYPDRLREEDIPLGARILAVADVFEALTQERAYRRAWPTLSAVQIIVRSKGTQFDPEVVDAFLRVIAREEGKSVEELLQAIEQETSSTPEPPAQRPNTQPPVTGVMRDIARAHQELYALYEIAQTVGSSLSLDETLSLLTTKLNNFVQCAACVIYLLDEEREELEARAAFGPQAALFRKLHLSLRGSLSGRAVEQQRNIFNGHAQDDFQATTAGEEARNLASLLAIPLTTADGTRIGCLSLYHEAVGAFTEDDLRLLSLIGQQAAMAIKNALTYEETRSSALTDELTGLPNTRYFFMTLEHEFSRAQREDSPLSLLLIDLDNFKTINDEFGHTVGDRVLREVAQRMRQPLRNYDTLVRHGGDEFYVILPHTTLADALEVAKRLRRAVDGYTLILRNNRRVRVHASIGAATYPENAQTLEALLTCADRRMYEAKRSVYGDGVQVA
ncbi:MAG TPA: diguanylate cyclase [Armatimonadetes bacterium]|nr:diguanylate cyclase [Armatimonadota bacterium]